ncbi:unnamed protein product, partial [Iphiclides podalirius]
MPPKKQLASNKSDSSDNEGTPDAAVEAIVHPLRRRTLCRLSNLYLILRHPLIPRALNRHLSTRLADEYYGVPNKIDALIGASLFPHLLCPGVIRSYDSSGPAAIRTVLGYVIMGSVPTLQMMAMTADCRQQFLQIVIRDSDRRYQCFLYRFNPHDPLVLYQFNRVCFGLTSSPYHALRTVRQLIDDDGAMYPLASRIASTSLYMDDVAFSLPSESEASEASQQLIDLFKGAQWDLIKWNSNYQSVLDNLPASHKITKEVEFDKSMQHKILGLHWSTDSDEFYFKISIPDDVTCTKRSILSTVARLWDIMGFVAPTVVNLLNAAKCVYRTTWRARRCWLHSRERERLAAAARKWRKGYLETHSDWDLTNKLPIINIFETEIPGDQNQRGGSNQANRGAITGVKREVALAFLLFQGACTTGV